MNRRLFASNRKTPLLFTAAVLACCMLLCACNKGTPKSGRNTSDGEKLEGSDTAAVTTTSGTTSAATTATDDTQPYVDRDYTQIYIPDSTPYKKITLDGVKDHHFIADDFCYIETERSFIFMDKDIELPGDFAVNVDAIINELENQLGISACPDSFEYCGVTDNSIYYGGFNPWEGWCTGKKIPIFLMVDRESKGLISCATASDAVLVIYECFSDELWNSVPEYRDNPWRRFDYMDYDSIAHELTHTITERNCDLTDILTEGIAQYMAGTVIDALADDYPSIGEYKEKTEPYDFSVPEAVNADNAERIFIEDYNTLTTMERGPEYVYGKYLYNFLSEEYGADYFSRLNAYIIANGLHYDYGYYDGDATVKYAEAIKSIFGDDVFTKFGSWCVANNHLQE